jgi:hypothetical protein
MTPSGIEPATFRFVAQFLNPGATISGPHSRRIDFVKKKNENIQGNIFSF